MKPCSEVLSEFSPTSDDEVTNILRKSTKASCALDPLPTKLLVNFAPEVIPFITYIINLALSTGNFPANLKSAIVKPLLKQPTLDPGIYKNYRPVSNLSFLSKLIEKVIATRLITHLEENNLLEEMQSAYKVRHSTETALLRIQNDLLSSVDSGSAVLLVLLDLSAAFDTVDHSLLLNLLEQHIGVKGRALQLLRSYLQDRTQCISINNIHSELVEILYGVPQGSVLGPVKFCVYTLPLGAILHYHGIQYHIYADDTQLYLAFDVQDPQPSLEKLGIAISDVRSWMISNKLKINDDKTEFLVITQPHLANRVNELKLQIGQCSIFPSPYAKNLGVVFDNTLCMEKQVRNICRSCIFHLRNIGSIRNLLSDSSAAQLVHSLVTSRLDHCNSLLYGLPDNKLNRLQRVQNIAARIITRTSKSEHITPVLQNLHWLPVKCQILYKMLVLAYQVLHESAPKYLCDLLKPYSPSRTLRSSNKLLFVESKTRLKTYGDRSFMAAAPKEWNKLPAPLRCAPSLECFKSELKTYLFKGYYNC